MSEFYEKHLTILKELALPNAQLPEIKRMLYRVSVEFKPSTLILSSPTFDPDIAKQYVVAVLHIGMNENPDVLTLCYGFFDRFFPPFVTYCGSKFLEMCASIYEEEKNLKVVCPLLRYISVALSFQPTDCQKRYAEMSFQLLTACSDEERRKLYPAVWQLISINCSKEDASALLETINTPDLASAAAQLVYYQSKDLLPLVLNKENSTFVEKFLNFVKSGDPVDASDFINRIGESMDIKLIEAFLETKLTIDEKSAEAAKNLCQKLLCELSNAQGADKAHILTALASAANKGFIDISLIADELNCSSKSEEIKLASMKIYVANVFDDYKETFEQIYRQGGQTLFTFLDLLPQAITAIFEKDKDWAFYFIKKVLRVKVPNQALLLRIALNASKVVKNPEEVNALVMRNINTKDVNTAKYLFKLMKLYDIKPNPNELDWFYNSRAAFEIVRAPEVPLIKELLEYGFITPVSLRNCLRAFRLRPRAAASLMFTDLLSLAKMVAKPLRYTIDDDDLLPPINWIDQTQIVRLYYEASSPFIFSGYGSLAREIIRTFGALLPFKEDFDEKTAVILMKFCLLFTSSFTECSISLAIDVYRRIKTTETDKIMKMIANEEIPVKFSPFTFKAIVECKGFDEACKLPEEKITQAIRYDREIASMFAEKIDTPKECMKTFLSFVGVEKHKEWVNQCQHELDVSEWKLISGDEKRIAKLPKDEVTEPKHIQALSEIEESEETEEIEDRKTFVFKEVEIEPAPKSHEFEERNLPYLISFLWFSKKRLENEKEVIKYSYECKDKRLLLGIICYADRFGIELDTEKIAKRMHATNKLEVITSAVFFKTQKGKDISNCVNEAINRCLSEMYMQKSEIIHQIVMSTPVKKFLIQSIASLFPEYNELFLTNTEDVIRMIQNMRTGSVKAEVAISTFFNATYQPNGLVFNKYLPTNYEWPDLLYSFGLEEKPFTPKTINSSLYKEMIKAIKRIPELISVLQWFNPNEKDIQAIGNDSAIKFLFPSTIFNKMEVPTINEDLVKFFSLMPPSFTRAFSRSIFVQCAPLLPENFLRELILYLTPVHGACLPKDSSFLILPCADSLAKDMANAGYSSSIPVLFDEAINGDCVSFELLNRFSDDRICKELKVTNASISKSDAAQGLVIHSINLTLKTMAAIKTIMKILPKGEVVAIVCNRQLVRSNNFVSVCVALAMIEPYVKGTEYEEMINAYRDPSLSIVTDEKHLAALEHIDEEMISYLIHES